MSTMGGGKFGHGFTSAAGTQLSSVMVDQIGNGAASYKAHRIIAAAVVGGTIAEVTGGKFANGAMTGAFSRAFNAENHDVDESEGDDIANVAEGWEGTPYADQHDGPEWPYSSYKGAAAEKGTAADCSGSTWKILQEVGRPFEYKASWQWDSAVSNGSIPFRRLAVDEALQVGDVIRFNGHLAIYAGDGEMWTARRSIYNSAGSYENKSYTKMRVDWWGPQPVANYRYQRSQ